MRRRFLLAAGVGGLLATVLFVLVLQSGRSGPFDRELLGNFYDGQARSLMDGRIDVPPDVPGFEGFRIGDETHIYQPIVPALARIPLFAVTDRLDGRLTGVSMLAAYVVALGYVSALAWRVRRSIRRDRPLGSVEAIATGFLVFGVGTGSLLFLAGKSWVYHEGMSWAAAFCLASFTHLTHWLLGAAATERRRLAQLVLAVLFAGLALNTRSTVGFGSVAALGACAAVLTLALALGWIDRRRPTDDRDGGSQRLLRSLTGWDPARSTTAPVASLGIIVVGVLAAVVLYAGVNHARFGSLFGVPLDAQVLVADDPDRRAALDANDGSLFGPQYVPSVLAQVLRPDALGVRPEFPYLSFPAERPSVIGDAVFSELDWSTSVPVGQPLLALGAVAGLVTLLAPRRVLRAAARDPDAGALPEITAMRLPVLGAALGGGVFIVFGYIAQRYLTDLLPFLVLTTVVGFHAVWANLADRSDPATVAADAVDADRADGATDAIGADGADSDTATSRRPPAWASGLALGVIAVGALWGAWVNAALALQYQQEISPGRTRLERSDWLSTQADLPGSLREPLRLATDEALPLPSEVGRLAVVGDCEAVYRGNGGDWYLIETTPPAGGAYLTLRRDGELSDRVPVARLAGTAPGVDAQLWLEPLGGDDVRLATEVARDGEVTRSWISTTFALADGDALELDLSMDWRTGDVVASQLGGDDERLQVRIALPPGTVEAEGGGPVTVTARTPPTPLCDQLVG